MRGSPVLEGGVWLALLLAAGHSPSPAAARGEFAQESHQEGPDVSGEVQAREARARALAWLRKTQNEDGSWGQRTPGGLLEGLWSPETWYSWQVAASALGSMALAAGPETEENAAAREAALRWLTSTAMPLRPSDWDMDHHWAALYGFVALVEASADGRLADRALRAAIDARGRAFYEVLERGQSLRGGWAYYDDEQPTTAVPTWDTSFCTALVIPALLDAPERWHVDGTRVRRAVDYVRRCALPEGAFAYDLTTLPDVYGGVGINRIQGSLARTQVCLWALTRAGDRTVTQDRLREGLEAFFEHHGYLEIAHMRPEPHEAWFENSGYFYFFGHHYAALTIELLPQIERSAYHARLRPHLLRYQDEAGWVSDFNLMDSTRVAGTAFLALALSAGLEETP